MSHIPRRPELAPYEMQTLAAPEPNRPQTPDAALSPREYNRRRALEDPTARLHRADGSLLAPHQTRAWLERQYQLMDQMDAGDVARARGDDIPGGLHLDRPAQARLHPPTAVPPMLPLHAQTGAVCLAEWSYQFPPPYTRVLGEAGVTPAFFADFVQGLNTLTTFGVERVILTSVFCRALYSCGLSLVCSDDVFRKERLTTAQLADALQQLCVYTNTHLDAGAQVVFRAVLGEGDDILISVSRTA